MKTQKRNHGFICEQCSRKVDPHPTSERNHCNYCLYSKHVDLDTPGDRLSPCQGAMRPKEIGYDGKKGYFIIYECVKCAKILKNKVAEDDNWDLIVQLSVPEK